MQSKAVVTDHLVYIVSNDVVCLVVLLDYSILSAMHKIRQFYRTTIIVVMCKVKQFYWTTVFALCMVPPFAGRTSIWQQYE